MYTVYCDGECIYNVDVDGLIIAEPKLDMELNKVGAFSFTIYPDHPYYNDIHQMKSVVTVYCDSEIVFSGRVLLIERGFYNEKSILCEGELAYLLDSIQYPYDFLTGDNHTTISELLEYFITNHNEQVADDRRKFKVGNITVTDDNDYIVRKNSDYSTTWEEINDKLIDKLGGYIFTRHESDGVYIDYLSDSERINKQSVEFGKNLLSVSISRNLDGMVTALIPLGAKTSNEENAERLTIKDVNDGKLYVYDKDAVNEFGYIFATEIFDDVTLPENLLKKGQKSLSEKMMIPSEIEVTAADLAGTDVSITPFVFGSYIAVESEPHGISEKMLASKMTITLDNPAGNKMTLGKKSKTLTEFNSDSASSNKNIVERVEKVESNAKINEGAVAEVRDIVNEANTKSDEANQKADDTNAKVDGLVYDNRNLIKGTEYWTDDAFYIANTYGPQNGTIEDGVLTVPVNNSAIDTHFVPVVAGETYTVSIDVKSTLSANGYTTLLQYYDDDGNRLSYAYISGAYDTDWKRIIKTITVPDGPTQFRLGLRSAANKMSYRLLKMEKGSKATGWSPAPEDEADNLRSDTNAAIVALREEVGSQIDQSAESVKTTVYENVYVKDEVDSLVSSVSTEVEQTKDSWQIMFNQFQADVDDIANGNDAKFEEIKKYIRFEDGNILLGNSESPLVLKIQNDRIQFLQNDYEVAYISDRKMYNTICSVIDRLEIGDSAWQVEHNEDGDTVVSLVPIY